MLTLRGVQIAFKGKDGRTATVTMDRYAGTLPPAAYASDEAFRNHVASAALGAIMRDSNYGPGWVADYQVIDIPDMHR